MHNTHDITANKHGGNTESAAANARNANHRTDQQQRVLEAIKDAPDGITMKEIAEAWGVQLNTISGRASALKQRGLIEKSGITRQGSAVLVPTGKVFKAEPFASGGLVRPSQVSYVGEQQCTLTAAMTPVSPAKVSFTRPEDDDPFEHQRAVYSRQEAHKEPAVGCQ